MSRVRSVAVVGGGPAGLYFALLAKRRRPDCAIEVFEQNPRDATYGFGIVLADRGMRRMADADAQSHDLIQAATYVTRHQVIGHRGATVFVEGTGHAGAISRLRLLDILQTCCEAAGVAVHYQTRIEKVPFDADVVVGADGVNSAVRSLLQAQFGTTSYQLSGRMAWYGTRRHFASAHLIFRRSDLGHFIFVSSPYSETMSTAVVQCDAGTWSRGFGALTDEERKAIAEDVFAPELEGHLLLTNNSVWRSLPVIGNSNWWAGNAVLLGDALHSAHPSIGSGSRIAMEDAIALADAFDRHADEGAEAIFRAFRAEREPQKRKFLDATEKSFSWYETFPERMEAFGPVGLVFDYLGRTGRISDDRLRSEFPAFVERYGTFSRPKAADMRVAQVSSAAFAADGGR